MKPRARTSSLQSPGCLLTPLHMLCLAVLVAQVQGAEQRPSVVQQTQPFVFTKIDLELLDKAGQLDRYFRDKGLVYEDAQTSGYIAAVGNAVLPKVPVPENVTWRFHVMRDPLPNAFALPNGSVYVNTGLLALLENEAQLASVLAHEETHVLNYHGYLANRSYRKKAVAAHIFAAAGAAGGAVGGIAGNSVYLFGSLMPALLEASIFGYSRELERAADLRAVEALNDSGYAAEEMPNTFRLLQVEREVQLHETFYQDHPKLKDRIAYVSELVGEMHPRFRPQKVEADAYLASTERVTRHNVGLEIVAGRSRAAVAEACRLVKQNPGSADNRIAMGDAFSALGPRTQEPTPMELSPDGKKEARNMAKKLTQKERDDALFATTQGMAAWEMNRRKSEEAYRKALELEPANAIAHRGLGFVYERARMPAQSCEEFRKYLELCPHAPDSLRIGRHLEAVEKELTQKTPNPPPGLR